MLNASRAAVALSPGPVPVAGNSSTTGIVASRLNSTDNIPTQPTRTAAVRELAHVIGVAHRGYDENAILIRGGGDDPWDFDSDHEARAQRRLAQARAGLDPGRSSPSGVASTAILALVEEGYGAATAEHIRTLYPTLAHGGVVTPRMLAGLRVDLTPSNLCEAGAFSADVSARTRQYIVENLHAGRAAAREEFQRDLTRAVYVVDGREISRPGLPITEALANFEAAIPDPEVREILWHIAFQGTLADAEAAATTRDEVFIGGYGTVAPDPSWRERGDLTYDIRRADTGDYTVEARNRTYATGTCDPHIADLDNARPLGAGSHYDVSVEVTIPASAIAQGDYDAITVTSAYSIDFHPPSPAARALTTLLRNVQASDTMMGTFIADADALRCAVRLEIERQIEDGSLCRPRSAEESTEQWRQVVGNAANDIAWVTPQPRIVALQNMAFAMHEHVRRFTGQLPDAMTLMQYADHYGVDGDRLDADFISEATAPFTIMQQAVMPALVDHAFGDQAGIISAEYELIPQQDPTATSPETMRLLRERFGALDARALDPPLVSAAPAATNEPGFPRRLEDGRRVIDIGDVATAVAFDSMTDTWRVMDAAGHATGDHLLYHDNTDSWVRRRPGLLGGAAQATAGRLLGSDLAHSLDILASLVDLDPAAATDILLQPGVLDSLASHVAQALPYSATQQPHAALPLQVAAEVCRGALFADRSLGQRIVDAWLPQESLANSPMARLLEHHSLEVVQPATEAVVRLLTELSDSGGMRQALYDRFEAKVGQGKCMTAYLEESPALGNNAFRKHIRERLADAGVARHYRSKRSLSPPQREELRKRCRMPNASELREYANEVTKRTQQNHELAVRMVKGARDAAANVSRRDEAEAAKRAIVKQQSEAAHRRWLASEDKAYVESQQRRRIEENERQDRLAADSHLRVQAFKTDRAARLDRLAAGLAAIGHAYDHAHRQQAAIAARQGQSRLAIDDNRRNVHVPAFTTPALPTANAHRALPHAAQQRGQLTAGTGAITMPPGSSFNPLSRRVEVPVISQGRDAVLSIPVNPERPVVVQVVAPRLAAIGTPGQPDTRATLVNVDNRPAGIAVTVRRDGHTGRFALPHQTGEPVRLDYGNGRVVSFTQPSGALMRNDH